ncbi:MAG: FAD-binding oxidoreductase [Clostridia bacterium]|jgi:glycolate oxidase|nr:FAD-binding oxidoreductase [Clostridia bacterium]MBT7121635.1 FAD-binding oxidoreductase [Clostridia bacterium]
MPYNKVAEQDIDYLRSIADRAFIGADIHEDFSHDEMTIYGVHMPEIVVEVKSTEQVSAVLKYANERGIPVTPRGSGTGLCGGAVALYGGILLSLAQMDNIIEFDNDNFCVTLQPGVLLMTLAEQSIAHDMMYPPEPGEKSATIGGNVMTNAGGMRAIKYGVTRDYVLGLTAVLPNGNVITLGGKVVKNSSGYSLIDLLVGSEGTLAVVTELTLKLIPLPGVSLSLLVPFDSLSKSFNAVPKILQSRTNPTAVEFMQREVIEAAEQYLGLHFPDKSAPAYLLLTFDGNTRTELDTTIDKVAEICLSCGANDVFISDTQERQESIWKARGAFLEAIKTSTTDMDECDVVVPRTKLASFMELVDTLETSHGLRLRSFGHAGDGNLHIYLCKDGLSESEWEKRCAAVMDSLYISSAQMGGQISGEHGVGHAKSHYLAESLGDDAIALMRGIKHTFDPKNILNPGKVC